MKGRAGQMEGRGLTVENEKKERGGMESYVGKMAEGWGSDTCGCGKKKKDGMVGWKLERVM